MTDNTIEIRDDNINVEEIMRKIQENIRRRQVAGELPPDPDSLIASASGCSNTEVSQESLPYDLSYISSNWDIHNNSFFISSHHPYFGKLLVKGRQLVHGEVRRYVDPMISRQSEFNASTVRFLTQTLQKCKELDCEISRQDKELIRKFDQQGEELIRKISQKGEELTRKIDRQEEVLNLNIKNCVNSTVHDIFSRIDKDLQLRVGLAHILEERIQKGLAQKSTASESIIHTDTDYFLFEERFRGSCMVIKQRQLAFLPYFENCSHVLDIGSGRGEFLEILRDHNIVGIGVDIDSDMVSYCRSRQLDVKQADAISFLEKLEDKSLDGIFIDQVVEHLDPEYLIRMLALCYQKLKFGYYLVVETVNPLSFVSFVNFYVDMTHKRPVHPETLQYLFNASGFRECDKKFFSPVSDESRLKKISNISTLDDTVQKNLEEYNHNIEILNTILFGAQDYAVIGKK
jgi:ubiquinone/menaquinone biosynthesis C-methylase UbiE